MRIIILPTDSLTDNEVIEAWEMAKRKWGDDIAQHIAVTILSKPPENVDSYTKFLGGRLSKSRWNDGLHLPGNHEKSKRELLGTLPYEEGDEWENWDSDTHVDYASDPARIVEARDELSRLSPFVIDSVMNGREPRRNPEFCVNGHLRARFMAVSILKKGPRKGQRQSRCNECYRIRMNREAQQDNE